MSVLWQLIRGSKKSGTTSVFCTTISLNDSTISTALQQEFDKNFSVLVLSTVNGLTLRSFLGFFLLVSAVHTMGLGFVLLTFR